MPNHSHSYALMKTFVLAVLLLLLVFLSQAGQPILAAQHMSSDGTMTSSTPSTPECWPLDVVVLIDESNSMVEGQQANDPEGYRLEAAKAILNLLISERRGFCPEALHRFGVIAFTASYGDRDDGLAIPVPMTDIDIPAAQDFKRETWSTGQSIQQAIDDLRENYPIRNGTDPALAFAAADAMLSAASNLPTPPGYQERRQVVILLTDGNPETSEFPSSRRPTYMDKLTKSLSTGDWVDRHIWIVAMGQNIESELNTNKAHNNLTMYEAWQAIANSHAGKLLASNDYSEQILSDILGSIIDNEFATFGEPIPCGELFVVEPYLQSLVLRFNKSLRYQEEYPVSISYLNDAGQEVYRFFKGKVDQGELPAPMVLRTDLYYREGTLEEYVFDYPLPGRWRFIIQGVETENCSAYVAARKNFSFAKAVMQQPTDIVPLSENPPYTDSETMQTFQIALQSDSGTLLSPLPDYPLAIVGQLRLPGGASRLPNGDPVLTYTFTANYNRYWESDQPVIAPVEGIYSLDLSGTAVHGLESYTVITDTVTYEVQRLGKLHFEITSPQTGQSLTCNTVQERKAIGNPIPVTVQFFDPEEQPAAASDYLDSNLGKSFKATLLDVGGVNLDWTYLAPAAQGMGLFEGILLPDQAKVIGCENVSVEVAFEGSLNKSLFIIMPSQTQTVSFERVPYEGVLVTVTKPSEGARFEIYPDFWAAVWERDIQPVRLSYRLTALNGSVLDPARVGIEPERLYQIRLIGPDLETYEDLDSTFNGDTLNASGGLSLTVPGRYIFEITATNDAFSEGYIPADEESIEIHFERYQTPLRTPMIARILSSITVLLICALLIWFLWHLFTRPVGILTFETPKIGSQLYEIKLGRPLRGLWHTYKENINPEKDATKPLKLSKVVITKAKPDLTRGHRAIELSLYDVEGEWLQDDTLHSGEDAMYSAGEKEVRVKYE